MRNLCTMILIAVILSQGCKKSGGSPAAPIPASPSPNYKKIKETRSVDNYTTTGYGPQMSQTKYIYNTAGQLS